MIAVDWGTTSCRAYRLDDETVIDRRDTPTGILQVSSDGFGGALRALVGPWIGQGERRILLAGMVGSRQGWRETAYLPCPVASEDIGRALVPVPFEGAVVLLAPGVSAADMSGVPELMRGEEAQVFGADIGDGTACLPGSHSKWVRIEDRRVVGFSTYLTGEAFGALRDHTILARSIRDSPLDAVAFDAGVARSADTGGILHYLFGVRSLGLSGRLADAGTASYLSGLIIGHEIGAALAPGTLVHLIGATHLTSLYARAIVARGGGVRMWGDDTAARGLARIGAHATWT